MDAIYIKKKDLDNYKLIGAGTEAEVYKVNNDYLYKIYTIPLREDNKDIDGTYHIDDDGVKVVNSHEHASIKNIDPYPYYVDYSGVKKVYDDHVIYDAMNRQLHVKETSLPQAPIYVDGKFKGCVLKNHHPYVNLHSLFLLPRKTKLKILSDLLNKVKELTDNNIYHRDLANYKIDKYSHSNVLINPFNLKTEIIDLDGKSTVYAKTYNKELYDLTYLNFNLLVMKYLFDIDYDKEIQEEDIEELIQDTMHVSNMNYETVYDIFDYTYNSYEKNNDLLLKLKRN